MSVMGEHADRAAGAIAKEGGDREEGKRAVAAVAAHERLRIDGRFFARGRQRVRIRGVTYGPFAADADGLPFPAPSGVAEDFARMRDVGINAIRTYHVPPAWLLEMADEQAMAVFIDVPWPKHVCFLDSAEACRHARQAVRTAARLGRGHPCVLAYSVANEISPDVVRWHGAARIQRFLAELRDVVKQDDPEGLSTYASYPPTEYLDLSSLDFATFNVYLHDPETFRRYLLRLQNLVGDRPLLLGEIGMDTLRHGEMEQARFLAGHVREAALAGLAGTFIFAWTDDWHTGGFAIKDWAFGITHADRSPKASYHALREVFDRSPAALLPQAPRVSVVVCTYNGGRTLEQCLRSLLELDYPDYEIIVVDDGSTDNTREILSRFPTVRAIHQNNHGLSFARNVGLHNATGSVVAYTDSDCYADPDWLTLLVEQFVRSGAHAVGGPNLSPEDGGLAACVAAAPGQPTHVLVSDQVAEHVPGCNMAFRREALQAINGFDYQYRKAGDDVDVCWRLQQAGMWITFAPGAFVWHHRRQTLKAYLRQQAGYGEAEALLHFKHPDKFNHRGDGKWRGVLYGISLQGLRLGENIVHRGTFGTGLFQCLYQAGPAHWAMLPSTLEWHLTAALVALVSLVVGIDDLTHPAAYPRIMMGFGSLVWLPAALVAVGMFGLSLLTAVLLARQAQLPAQHDGFRARCLVTLLCYLQPLVRSWARYRTRLFAYRRPQPDPDHLGPCRQPLPLSGRRTVEYWTERSYERTELLGLVVAYLNERGWGRTIDSGWSDWDLEVYCDRWTVVRVRTAQEEHGNGRRLIRVHFLLRATPLASAMVGLALPLIAALLAWSDWPKGFLAAWPLATALGPLLAVGGFLWWRGTHRASLALAVFHALARDLGLFRVDHAACLTADSMPSASEFQPHAAEPQAADGTVPAPETVVALQADFPVGAGSREFLPVSEVPGTPIAVAPAIPACPDQSGPPDLQAQANGRYF
jgi:GT2 family glycosyltransferase